VCSSDLDSLPDIMVWGNFHSNNVEIGRQDAFSGLLLINMGKGKFSAADIPGIRLNGQSGRVRSITLPGGPAYLLPLNDDSLRIIRQLPR
jgi:hypothetical protein